MGRGVRTQHPNPLHALVSLSCAAAAGLLPQLRLRRHEGCLSSPDPSKGHPPAVASSSSLKSRSVQQRRPPSSRDDQIWPLPAVASSPTQQPDLGGVSRGE
ncbi:hypothetical protein E2562_021248 [Oryza meyeriana var. granulata]|uniref:Uncharacterized protein n=1 Tax=Oryza meyeriana var. granulata TaxID=110450 RepID=A0A6G1E1E7_9ORYZ|nr:hypothetical protein E2562_021248 [Oryza meyeriana var. granulata]